MQEQDILVEIPNEDLPNLRDLYSKQLPFATHVYSFLNTAMKWMKVSPEKSYIKIFSPNGDWRRDGTFVALLQWSCYDLFVFTLEETCERLEHALMTTQRIDWSQVILFYAVHQNHTDTVYKVLDKLELKVEHSTKTDFWWMPKEQASQLTVACPENFEIKILKPEHAEIINEIWPHRYPGSVNYLRTFIEMNGGHGVFTKTDGKLVSWVLKNQMGTLGILQTIDAYKRMGLGSAVTKSLSREIALEGHNPLGTVLVENTASQAMFRNIGFSPSDWCQYIVVEHD